MIQYAMLKRSKTSVAVNLRGRKEHPMNHADPGPAPDTLILGSADVVAAFDWSEAITALRRQYGAMMR